jgi:cytochrome c553
MTVKKMLLIAAGVTFYAAAAAADPQQLITVCAECHGQRGDKPTQPQFPILAGQYASYLRHALVQYRDGSRRDPVMNAQAANLTDRDIRMLADYYAAQPGPLYTPALGRAE